MFGQVHLILYPVASNQLKRDVEKLEGVLQRLLRWSRTSGTGLVWRDGEGWGLTVSYNFGKDSQSPELGDGGKLFLVAPGDKIRGNSHNVRQLSDFQLGQQEKYFYRKADTVEKQAPREVRGLPLLIGSGQDLAKQSHG